MARTKKPANFEQSLEKLESLVDALETGDLTLEQSLKSFEEGIALTRACQTALNEAEQTVKVLTEKNGEPVFENTSFEPTESDDLDD